MWVTYKFIGFVTYKKRGGESVEVEQWDRKRVGNSWLREMVRHQFVAQSGYTYWTQSRD